MTEQYAIANPFDYPMWYAPTESVIFSALVNEQRVIQETTLEQRSANTLRSGLGSPHLEIQGDSLIYIDDADPVQLSSMSLTGERTTSTMMPFLPLVYDSRSDAARHISSAPSGNYLALYDADDFLLATTSTDTACYLKQSFLGESYDDGIFVLHDRWSPDERYLALNINPDGYGSLAIQTVLVILDTQSNDLQVIKFAESGEAWNPTIFDLAWSSDSRHLAIIGRADSQPSSKYRLNFIDIVDHSVQLGSDEFGVGHSGSLLRWSSDGMKLAHSCPTQTEGRICVYEVSATGGN